MSFSAKPLKNWFGYSRRERRATSVLLLILVIIIVLRYIIPDSKIQITDITGTNLQGNTISDLASDRLPAEVIYTSYQAQQSFDSLKRSGSSSAPQVPKRSNNAGYAKAEKQARSAQKKFTDINTCDSSELVKLPGIGPVLSARILKYRRYLGGYSSTAQLKEVYGLSPETYELIKGRVFADTGVIRRIGINTADYKELLRIRYLEKYEISAILKYRELNGRINNINELTDNKLITGEKAQRVGPYLRFD